MLVDNLQDRGGPRRWGRECRGCGQDTYPFPPVGRGRTFGGGSHGPFLWYLEEVGRLLGVTATKVGFLDQEHARVVLVGTPEREL